MERDFKARRSTPFHIVLDFTQQDDRIQVSDVESPAGLDWKAFGVKDIPGFHFVSNALSPRVQRDLVRKCLKEYTMRPNVSNLDTHYILPPDSGQESGLWSMYKRQITTPDDSVIELRLGEANLANGYQVDGPETEVKHLQPLPATQLIHKIRWFSLGYHYNWSNKSYHFDRPVAIPKQVRDLTKTVVKALEKALGIDERLYEPEAGIVNHYSYRDTLMAHQDRSELDPTSPLVSISLGASAIFVMGFPTNDLNTASPTPMWLRSGDISVMSGPCRRNFHGVPRIVEDTLPEYLSTRAELDSDEDVEEWRPFGLYMESGKRLNLNVRQVYPRALEDQQ
jgi:alkylated DNA repair protein alkB family protein 1